MDKESISSLINSLEHCLEYYEYDLLCADDCNAVYKVEGFKQAIEELKLYRKNCEQRKGD